MGGPSHSGWVPKAQEAPNESHDFKISCDSSQDSGFGLLNTNANQNGNAIIMAKQFKQVA